MIELYEGDCLQIMPTLPDGCADMILADPPYQTTQLIWDSEIPLEPLWEQLRRVIKPNGAILMFGSQPFTSRLVMSNPAWFRYEWIWEKSTGTGYLDVSIKPLKCHESVCVFYAETPTYNPQKARAAPRSIKRAATDAAAQYNSHTRFTTHNNGQAYPRSIVYSPKELGTIHPTQKPVDLLRYFIRSYTNKGDTVLDFCIGSGSTGAACIEEGRRFIGIEKDAQYFQVARRRLDAEMNKPRTLRMELIG